MKKKIFFAALILFSVFLNSMILMVSIIILRDKLSTVRDKCLAEHYVIASSLIGDMQALEQRGNPVEENIDNLMRLYSRYLQGRGNGLAVAFSGEWIYESPAFASGENTISPPDTGSTHPVCLRQLSGSVAGLRSYVYGEPERYRFFMASYEKYSFFYRHCGNTYDVIFSVSIPEYYFSPVKANFQCVRKDCKRKLRQQDFGSGKG